MQGEWRRGRRCEAEACLEMRYDGDEVLLRSTNDPQVVIRLTALEWRAFRDSIKDGDFADAVE